MKTLKWWLKRLVVLFVGFIGVLLIIIYGTRAYLQSVGTRELASVSRRLDDEEPGWKLEAIEAKRRESAPRPEQNATPLVLKTAEQLSEQNKAWSTWRGSEDWTPRVLSPNLPREKFHQGMQAHKDSTISARQQARAMRYLERGYYPLAIGDNPYATLLPHVQKSREVATLLEYDALLAALESDPNQAIASSHAILNIGRSIGDEPFLISQLVRIACTKISTQTALQILAWGEPKLGLAELQAAYRAEADVPFLLVGLRGERAVLHRTFDGLESGKLSFSDMEIHGLQKANPAQDAAFHLYRGLLPGDHAKCAGDLDELHGGRAPPTRPTTRRLCCDPDTTRAAARVPLHRHPPPDPGMRKGCHRRTPCSCRSIVRIHRDCLRAIPDAQPSLAKPARRDPQGHSLRPPL